MQTQIARLTLILSSVLMLPLNTALAAIECKPVPQYGPGAAPIVNYLNPSHVIQLERISTCRVGYFNTKGAEIVAYDPGTKRLFIVNQGQRSTTSPSGVKPSLDIIDIHDPYFRRRLPLHPQKPFSFSIDLSSVFEGKVNLPTSVAVKGRMVAVAMHPDPSSSGPGKVLFYDTAVPPPAATSTAPYNPFLKAVEVGYEPDMVTFTPDGQTLLVANTGSPPTAGGSVSLIDIRDIRRGIEPTPVTVDFSPFIGSEEALQQEGVRIYPGLPAGQSLLPEYITVSPHHPFKAWIGLEINNALAVLDIKQRLVTAILPLGVKDHSQSNSGFVSWDQGNSSNGFDASDQDCLSGETCENPKANPQGKINIANWPVLGMYQPDAIEAYHTHGRTYVVTASEGSWFNEGERVRVKDLKLDPRVFPNAADLQQNSTLGRLRVTNLQGKNKDGYYEALYSFSTRSFSIWSEAGKLIFDSGDDFERITAQTLRFNGLSYFNSDDSANEFDTKSDDQGVQPDGLTIGKLYGRYYVFVVLQRSGGIMVYDITNPYYPRFQQYINNRNLGINPAGETPSKQKICTKGFPDSDPRDPSGEPLCPQVGDLGPEGVVFITEADSPTKEPLLVVANQTSGSTTLYRIKRAIPRPHHEDQDTQQ